jgi:hypothetical protein
MAAARLSAAPVSEYDVKAAYLFNFLQFVTWPGSAFDSPTAPVRVCIVGRNPFGDVLRAVTRNEIVGGRPIEIAEAKEDEPLRRCQVAFIPAGSNASGALRVLSSLPVVTVGESDDFLAAGGVIRFAVVDQRVRFDINLKQATQRGVTLSSRLLQVARQVLR